MYSSQPNKLDWYVQLGWPTLIHLTVHHTKHLFLTFLLGELGSSEAETAPNLHRCTEWLYLWFLNAGFFIHPEFSFNIPSAPKLSPSLLLLRTTINRASRCWQTWKTLPRFQNCTTMLPLPELWRGKGSKCLHKFFASWILFLWNLATMIHTAECEFDYGL